MKRLRRSSASISQSDAAKIMQLDHVKPNISCRLPPCDEVSFDTYEEYEAHHRTTHVNRCLECNINLPDEHFLSLHISENHDPFTAVKRDRGDKTYACFVQGCEKICGTWHKRKFHCIDKHQFPSNYDFLIVDQGTDGRRSMLRSEQSMGRGKQELSRDGDGVSASGSSRTSSARRIDESRPPVGISSDMELLADAVAALKFVPNSVRFGYKRRRPGLRKA